MNKLEALWIAFRAWLSSGRAERFSHAVADHGTRHVAEQAFRPVRLIIYGIVAVICFSLWIHARVDERLTERMLQQCQLQVNEVYRDLPED